MRSTEPHLIAQFTDVRLLSRVHPQVELEGGGVREGPGADLAGVRSLSCVDSHVDRQLGPLVELGTALVTLERLLLGVRGVGPHVILDVSLEGLVTHVTLVHLLPLMEGENVSLESVGSGVRLVTEMALELLVVLVKLGVSLEIPAASEGGVAQVTFVWFVSAVDSLVDDQLTSSGE